MDRVLFLNSFFLCPQKKNIGNIRFILLLTHIISHYDKDQLNSLIASSGITIKPNHLADFFKIKMSGVRALMNKDTTWLDEARWINRSGEIERCFTNITNISYKGYFVEINEGFVREIINNLDKTIEIDAEKFGRIISVYAQVLYSQIALSGDGTASFTFEGMKKIFEIEDCYINSSNLHKKCIKEPCDKLNKIFRMDLMSKKISFGGGDFIWVVGSGSSLGKLKI